MSRFLKRKKPYKLMKANEIGNEELIITENELAKQIFDYCPIGKTIVDLNGNWLQVNEALCVLTGYEEYELLNCSFNDITHPEDISMDVEMIASLLNEEQSYYEIETRYIRKDNEIVNVLVTASMVWENKKPKYYLVNVQNIEKRKRLEYQNELITNHLKRVNEEKDDYLNTVSHELRSPLTNIKMAISMIRARQVEQLPIVLEKYIDILEHECAREINLINDLLDIQKLEAGYTEANNVEVINLSDLLNSLVNSFSNSLAKIRLDIEPSIEVKINLNSLNRIVGELLNNAYKYTDENGEIYITLNKFNNETYLSIKNTATLSNADIENMFKKFYRLNYLRGNVRKTGTGLGLPLIKKLIEKINCKLKIINTDDFIEMVFIIPN